MKHLSILVVTLLLTSQTSFAKDNSKKEHKLQIGINFSPNRSFRTLKNSGDSSVNFILDSRNNSEKPILGFNAGIDANYHINKKIGIGLGIQYMLSGYKVVHNNYILSFYDPLTGFPGPSDTVDITLKYKYNFLSVPLSINLTLGNGKIRFYSSTGISANFLLNSVGKLSMFNHSKNTHSDNSSKNDISFMNKFELGAFASAGVSLTSKNMNIIVAPIFRYNFTKLANAPMNEHLYNMGLNITVLIGVL